MWMQIVFVIAVIFLLPNVLGGLCLLGALADRNIEEGKK
jgi:hypothetical protein